MVLMRLGLKGVKYLGMSQNFTYTLVYQMGIEIYDQISIIRNYSKVKIGLGLKVVKIAWNVAKVGVHANPNQVSIIRSWSKLKLHRVVLLGFGLKESKITLNITKVGMHSYLPNAHLNL